MADNGKDQYVTRMELDLRLKNIEQTSSRIEKAVEEVAQELKEFKGILNPAFSTVERRLDNHIEQDKRDKQRSRDKWSPLQIIITAIVALAAVGMFIMSIIK